MPSYTIICEVERENLRAAISLTEQIVEHGYVDFARVKADRSTTIMLDDGVAPIELKDLDGEESIRFLYERAKQVGYSKGEADARRSSNLSQAKQNHRLVAQMLKTACDAVDQEIRFVLGRSALALLNGTPMMSPYIEGITSRLSQCNLNNSGKIVPLGILEAARDLAIKASEEINNVR